MSIKRRHSLSPQPQSEPADNVVAFVPAKPRGREIWNSTRKWHGDTFRGTMFENLKGNGNDLDIMQVAMMTDYCKWLHSKRIAFTVYASDEGWLLIRSALYDVWKSKMRDRK